MQPVVLVPQSHNTASLLSGGEGREQVETGSGSETQLETMATTKGCTTVNPVWAATQWGYPCFSYQIAC